MQVLRHDKWIVRVYKFCGRFHSEDCGFIGLFTLIECSSSFLYSKFIGVGSPDDRQPEGVRGLDDAHHDEVGVLNAQREGVGDHADVRQEARALVRTVVN